MVEFRIVRIFTKLVKDIGKTLIDWFLTHEFIIYLLTGTGTLPLKKIFFKCNGIMLVWVTWLIITYLCCRHHRPVVRGHCGVICRLSRVTFSWQEHVKFANLAHIVEICNISALFLLGSRRRVSPLQHAVKTVNPEPVQQHGEDLKLSSRGRRPRRRSPDHDGSNSGQGDLIPGQHSQQKPPRHIPSSSSEVIFLQLWLNDWLITLGNHEMV
jgi:hypothetical protein